MIFELTSITMTSRQTCKVIIAPEMIKPDPKAAPRKISNRGRLRGKSCIITDTPKKRKTEKETYHGKIKENTTE